jgi:hypothetical protein
VCVFQISDPENGHIADCSEGEFEYELCCTPPEEQVQTEICYNDIDDDDDGYRDCQDADCYTPYETYDCGESVQESPPTEPGHGIWSTLNYYCSNGSPYYTPSESRCCIEGTYWNGSRCANSPENCNNGLDDDKDDRNDTADSDCLLPATQTAENMEYVNCSGTHMNENYCFGTGGERNNNCHEIISTQTHRYCSIATDGPREKSWGVSAENGTRVVWNGSASEYEFEKIPENCSNSVDDDHDGLADCADSDCQVGINDVASDADVDSFDCHPGGADGAVYWCSDNLDDLGNGPRLCCLEGYATQPVAGGYECVNQNPNIENCADGIDNLDGVDADGNPVPDGYIDCADPDCYEFDHSNNPNPPYYNPSVHSCEGNFQTSENCAAGYGSLGDPDYFPPGDNYSQCLNPDGDVRYCAYGEDPNDASNNAYICCPAGSRAKWFTDWGGYWGCEETDPCYDEFNTYPCVFSYFDDFEDWVDDPDCLFEGSWDPDVPEDSVESSACCLANSYGGFDYWSDSSNVRVI